MHKIATITKNVFGAIDDAHISSMIAAARSLGDTPSMQSFRATLRALLVESVDWLPNSRASGRDLARNKALVDAFVPAGSKTDRLRRAIVFALFNGPWESSRVVHHCQGCCTSKQHFIAKACTFGVASMAGCQPLTWPRHRWTGAGLAVSWFGLLEATHCLFSRTYVLWAGKQPGGKSAVRLVAVGNAVAAPSVGDHVAAESANADAGDGQDQLP